jgi:hypothetical protein
MPRGATIWIGTGLLALALALALASCGGDSPEATAKARSEATATTPSRADVPNKSSEGETRTNTKDSTLSGGPCATRLGGFVAAIDGLRGALVAGLAYEQYVGQLKSIVGAYDELPVDQLPLGCLRDVGTPSEKALNRYIAAGNEWTDCVEVPSCEAASIEAALQAKWHQASEYLSKAQRGLRRQSAG